MGIKSYWRTESARVIAEVIRTHPELKGKTLIDEIRRAYPFGSKQYWPYKVWRSEVRYRLGLDRRRRTAMRRDPVPPEQGALFVHETEAPVSHE